MDDLQQLVLMPETRARRALSGQRVSLRVLTPVGLCAGRGVLRVLRVRQAAGGEGVDLVCGYESYESIAR